MSKIRAVLPIVIVGAILLFIASRAGAIPSTAFVFFNQGVYSATVPEEDIVDLEKQHKASKVLRDGKHTYDYTKEDRAVIKADSAKCIACHGTMVDVSKKPDDAPYPIHQKMLTATMLDFSCTDCHKEIDISRRSPEKATIRVDRDLCPKCHETGGVNVTTDTFVASAPPQMPPLMGMHGTDQESGKKWIKDHPKIVSQVGVGACRECHRYNSELDFCRVCHLRDGMRPDSHRVVVNTPINRIFPNSPKSEITETKWLGFHFVFVRESLAKLGVNLDSPRNLPMDKIEKLSCGACHNLKDWCTRCHIKHNDEWLDPVLGHPLYVQKYGTKYCFRCHDTLGSKCVSCHEFVGRLD